MFRFNSNGLKDKDLIFHTTISKSHKLQIMNHMFGVYLISTNRFSARTTRPINPTTFSKNAGIDTFFIFSDSLLLLFFNLEYVLKISAIKQIKNTVTAIFLFLKRNLDFLVRFFGIVKFPKHQIRVIRKIREIRLKKASIIRNSQNCSNSVRS